MGDNEVITSSLSFSESLKICMLFCFFFLKNSIFNKVLPPGDGPVRETLQHIFLMLTTQNS